MSCKPTYKGVRYNSLEELYNANGVNEQQKQQAQQLYSQYLKQNPNGSIEQFKSWVNNQSNVQYQLPQNIQGEYNDVVSPFEKMTRDEQVAFDTTKVSIKNNSIFADNTEYNDEYLKMCM